MGTLSCATYGGGGGGGRVSRCVGRNVRGGARSQVRPSGPRGAFTSALKWTNPVMYASQTSNGRFWNLPWGSSPTQFVPWRGRSRHCSKWISDMKIRDSFLKFNSIHWERLQGEWFSTWASHQIIYMCVYIYTVYYMLYAIYYTYVAWVGVCYFCTHVCVCKKVDVFF